MIIFDSSTLGLLTRIDVLDSFLSSFEGTVIIPAKVRLKATRSDKEDAESINRHIEDKKIGVVKVKNVALVKRFMDDFSIDAGEAAALTLAGEKKLVSWRLRIEMQFVQTSF